MSVPAAYAWLTKLDGLPQTIARGLELLGTKEVVGKGDSPVIMGWAKEVGVDALGYRYTGDAVPWCGLFAAVVVKRAVKPIPYGPLYALNWQAFGKKPEAAGLGDVLVFKRPGGGHVGFYVGEDESYYCVLGGNQSDAVSFSWIAKARCVAVRRPDYKIQPAAVKPYRLKRTGAVSTNEA